MPTSPLTADKISVVICAFSEQRWDDICAAIASLEQQSLVPEDVVLVIDYNDRLFERALAAFEQATVIRNTAEKGLSGARNTGIETARGHVILFLDDDATADRRWVENMVAPLQDPGIVAVGGLTLPAWDGGTAPPWFPEEFYWVVGCSYRGLPAHRAQIRNPSGGNSAFRVSSLRECGGFASTLGRVGDKPVGCEETDLSLRIAAAQPQTRMVLARDAVIHHRIPRQRQTTIYFLRRCYWEGVSKAVLAHRLGARAQGLSVERQHALRTLPQGMLLAVAEAWKRRSPALALRAGNIPMGLAMAAAGYVAGSMKIASASSDAVVKVAYA